MRSTLTPELAMEADPDLDYIEEVAAELPGAWSVDVLADDGHQLEVLLIPEEGDRFAPSFLIERVPGAWRLSTHRWDEFEALWLAPTLTEALAAVQQAAAAAAILGSARLN